MSRSGRLIVLLVVVLSVCGLSSPAGAASPGEPAPTTAVAIVLTRSDVANVLHERVKVVGEKTYATPKGVFKRGLRGP